MMSLINTHSMVKSLITTGLTESQAEAISDAVLLGQHDLEQFVTKEQFIVFEKELPTIKAYLAPLRQNVTAVKDKFTGLKIELTDFRAETQSEFAIVIPIAHSNCTKAIFHGTRVLTKI